MSQSDLVLDKYWVTQSGYFRLATTVEFGMGIIDGKILFCHGISEGGEGKKFSTREYNDRMVYECFNNTIPYHGGSPALNLPTIIIDDSPRPYKRARYAPDMLTAAISVASGKSVSTLTSPSYFQQVLVLTSDDTNPHNFMKTDNPVRVRVKIGYYSRWRDGKRFYKKSGFISPRVLTKTGNLITVMGFFRNNSGMRTFLVEHQNVIALCSVYWCICLPYISYFIC